MLATAKVVELQWKLVPAQRLVHARGSPSGAASSWLQGYMREATPPQVHQEAGEQQCTNVQVSQCPPSLEDGLSGRPSFTPAEDFFCFCLDFLSMWTFRQHR